MKLYWSLPAWGVWIEIRRVPSILQAVMSLPAWGVWIEMIRSSKASGSLASHSPHGECGLKSELCDAMTAAIGSLPAWGVWIEIGKEAAELIQGTSLPAWGVWIEIGNSPPATPRFPVTPRMGSVD